MTARLFRSGARRRIGIGWWGARWQALFDAGPLGLGSLAAHGHADALAIWASLDGKPLLIDAGTYAYHEDPAWRDHFRSTPAHNTLTLDGRNQSEIQGAFLWGRKARSRFVAHDLRAGWVEGETDAYLPDTITRRVQLTGDALTMRDRVRRDAPGAIIACAPDDLRVACGDGALRLLEVQPESRPRMDSRAFINGYRPQVGEQFG